MIKKWKLFDFGQVGRKFGQGRGATAHCATASVVTIVFCA